MAPAAYITRTSAFLPNAPVENDQMERLLGQINGRPSRARRVVLRSNGIRRRYYAIDPRTLEPTHTNASLTAKAIRGLVDGKFALLFASQEHNAQQPNIRARGWRPRM